MEHGKPGLFDIESPSLRYYGLERKASIVSGLIATGDLYRRDDPLLSLL
jgi:hypothetical protein